MTNADSGVTAFVRAAAAAAPDEEPVVLPEWGLADWEALFSHSQRISIARGDKLIRQNAAERALYFIASGVLEVISVASYIRVSSIGWFHPGSVVGELSFLDGKARSAEIVAVADSDLYRVEYRDYQAFAEAHPRKACDLILPSVASSRRACATPCRTSSAQSAENAKQTARRARYPAADAIGRCTRRLNPPAPSRSCRPRSRSHAWSGSPAPLSNPA